MHKSDTEHGCTIYFDAANSGYVLGGGLTARNMDIKATVVEGGDTLRLDRSGNGINNHIYIH